MTEISHQGLRKTFQLSYFERSEGIRSACEILSVVEAATTDKIVWFERFLIGTSYDVVFFPDEGVEALQETVMTVRIPSRPLCGECTLHP